MELVRIERLLSLKKNVLSEKNQVGLHDTRSRQIYISNLMFNAKVNTTHMPYNKNNKLKFPFNQLLEKLNSILLSQYLIKENTRISKEDVREIQRSNIFLTQL